MLKESWSAANSVSNSVQFELWNEKFCILLLNSQFKDGHAVERPFVVCDIIGCVRSQDQVPDTVLFREQMLKGYHY